MEFLVHGFDASPDVCGHLSNEEVVSFCLYFSPHLCCFAFQINEYTFKDTKEHEITLPHNLILSYGLRNYEEIHFCGLG